MKAKMAISFLAVTRILLPVLVAGHLAPLQEGFGVFF
jgi:hypothetical protein